MDRKTPNDESVRFWGFFWRYFVVIGVVVSIVANHYSENFITGFGMAITFCIVGAEYLIAAKFRMPHIYAMRLDVAGKPSSDWREAQKDKGSEIEKKTALCGAVYLVLSVFFVILNVVILLK